MNIALIVAAGTGQRMGSNTPKQFLLVNDQPLLVYTITAFEKNQNIDSIYVVASKDYLETVKAWKSQFGLNKLINVIEGGNTRQESVYRGLKALKAKNDDIILIHDGARPLVSQDIINENIDSCLKYDAIDTVIKADDTIVHSIDEKTINNIPSRNELYQSQTPQTFRYELILSAHEAALKGEIPNVTDDAKLVISMGKSVHLVAGNKQNFKITTADDLKIFKALL